MKTLTFKMHRTFGGPRAVMDQAVLQVADGAELAQYLTDLQASQLPNKRVPLSNTDVEIEARLTKKGGTAAVASAQVEVDRRGNLSLVLLTPDAIEYSGMMPLHEAVRQLRADTPGKAAS